MTYQVTMIATDGIVMASDRCESWGDEGGRKVRTTNAVRKIYIVENAAWTFSGGNLSGITAAYLADEIKGTTTLTQIREAIQRCGNQAGSMYPYNPTNADILVAAVANEQCIIRAHISPKTVCLTVEDGKFVSGDWDNLASFFPEHFYSADKTIAELIPLAAYSVLLAHKFNPRFVEGLDIAICQDQIFKFIDEEPYKRAQSKIDQMIWNVFSLPSR